MNGKNSLSQLIVDLHLDVLDLTNLFMILPALDGSGPTSSSHAKPNGKALILYDGMEQSPGPSGLWGNNPHGGNRRQRQQTLLKNRQLYRSNPNMISESNNSVLFEKLTNTLFTLLRRSKPVKLCWL